MFMPKILAKAQTIKVTEQATGMKNEIVITDNDGKKEALVRKIIKPQICGVVIVCEGGGDIKVNERVLKAVSTVLGISRTVRSALRAENNRKR